MEPKSCYDFESRHHEAAALTLKMIRMAHARSQFAQDALRIEKLHALNSFTVQEKKVLVEVVLPGGGSSSFSGRLVSLGGGYFQVVTFVVGTVLEVSPTFHLAQLVRIQLL
ncbi:MAG: hypothetical protein AAB495_02910 [Patescibacteria group bacterium]